MTQNDTDWYNVSQPGEVMSPPRPSPAGHVFHSKPGFVQWIPWIPCGALLMLLDRWMESITRQLFRTPIETMSTMSCLNCVPWLPWPKTECQQSTEKTAKDAMLKGDWPLSRFGLLLSNANKQQETTTNELPRRHVQPFAMLLKLQVLGVRLPLYRDFSMPQQCCFHAALWRSYDERYHSRLSSKFQEGSSFSKQRIMYMYNNMFQWIISVVEVMFDLHTRRHHPMAQDLPSSKAFLCSLDPTLHRSNNQTQQLRMVKLCIYVSKIVLKPSQTNPMTYWCVLRREFSGMIHWPTIFIIIPATPSNPPISIPCVLAPVTMKPDLGVSENG